MAQAEVDLMMTDGGTVPSIPTAKLACDLLVCPTYGGLAAPYLQCSTIREMEIHARLRRETASDHQRIESSLDLLKPTLSLAEYQCVLRAFYGFYGPLEQRLQDTAASVSDLGFTVPSRSALLARDLAVLGVPQRDIAHVRCCGHLPMVASVAQVAGCVYVLEGASLGGQLIARALLRSLGLNANRGASFFVGSGAATGARWKRTLRWLDEVVREGADPDAVVSSARETFRAFHEWLALREPLQ